MPLLAMRLARPTLLVDVNGLPLDDIVQRDGHLHLGALVRHHRLEDDATVAVAAPLLAEAARWIGHPAIRHRGTLGGSLAHADPTGELPAALVALRGSVVVEGRNGRRRIAAADLFDGFLTTTIESGELLIEVAVPVAPVGQRTALCEWAPRHHDFADAGVALATVHDDQGQVVEVGAAAFGVGNTPVDIVDALQPVLGERAASDALLRAVAGRVEEACRGEADKAELAGLLAARAVHRVFERDEERS
jgi:carbon-monoxide dehydrogenase medium subunit